VLREGDWCNQLHPVESQVIEVVPVEASRGGVDLLQRLHDATRAALSLSYMDVVTVSAYVSVLDEVRDFLGGR
jgi:hypothetical protein